MKLSTQAIGTLSNNIRLINKIALSVDKSADTVRRWVRENSLPLTTEQVLQIIERETGMSRTDILESENTAA